MSLSNASIIHTYTNTKIKYNKVIQLVNTITTSII